MVTVAFAGTGLSISELIRNRQLAFLISTNWRNKPDSGETRNISWKMLIETSPAAIITMDSNGTILRGNDAARQLFAPEEISLAGHSVRSYLPELYAALRNYDSKILRLQCRPGDIEKTATAVVRKIGCAHPQPARAHCA